MGKLRNKNKTKLLVPLSLSKIQILPEGSQYQKTKYRTPSLHFKTKLTDTAEPEVLTVLPTADLSFLTMVKITTVIFSVTHCNHYCFVFFSQVRQSESYHQNLIKGSKKINSLPWNVFDSISTYTFHPLKTELQAFI